jgi:hypothetical protein
MRVNTKSQDMYWGCRCWQRHPEHDMMLNWLQVFRSADAARRGVERRLPHQTCAVCGERCARLRANIGHCDAEDRHVC